MNGVHSRRSVPTFWRVWFVGLALFGSVMALWALASPLASGADEPTTIVRAAAAVRGQLVGGPVGSTPSEHGVRTLVTIPETFRKLDNCYAFHPSVSAACVARDPLTSNRSLGSITTLVGHYPPLYYLIVGLPSYLPGASRTLYAMRMAGVCINAALLALTVYAIRRWARSTIIMIGFVFAVSPMVLFYSAVVNPSGLEMCSAICLWTSATIWAVDYRSGPPTGLLWTITLSAVVLVQARPASLVWPVLVGIALIPLVWRSDPRTSFLTKVGALSSRRTLWAMFGVFGVSWLLAVGWLVVVHSLQTVGANFPPPGTPAWTLIKESVEYMPSYLEQAVGVLGWLDTFLPSALVHFWYVGVAVILTAGLILSKARGRISILLVMMFSFVVPTGGTLADVRGHGFSSQGRYFLPVFVGLPIVAAALVGRSLRDRNIHLVPGLRANVIRLGLAAVAVAQVVAFGAALRRYLVGVDGPIFPSTSVKGAWQPPLPGIWLDALSTVTIGLLYWFLARSVAVRGRRPNRLNVGDEVADLPSTAE